MENRKKQIEKTLACLLFLMLSQIIPVRAQAPNILFAKTYGGSGDETGYSSVMTPDGKIMTIGSTNSIDGLVGFPCLRGGTDLWLVIADSSGNNPQSICIGGSDDEYYSTNLIMTGVNRYTFFTSTLSSNGDVQCSPPSFPLPQFWSVNLDTLGQISSQACYNFLDDGAYRLLRTKDNGILMQGITDVFTGTPSGIIVKFDSLAGIDWYKGYPGEYTEYTLIYQDTDSSFFAGWSSCTFDTSHNICPDTSFTLAHLDTAGNILSHVCLGSGNKCYLKYLFPSDSGFVGIGNSSLLNCHGNIGIQNIWVVWFDSAMNILQQRCYGGSNSDYISGALQLPNGDFIIGGNAWGGGGDVHGFHSGSDIWVFRITHDGTILWDKCIGGSGTDELKDITITNDNRILLTGNTDSQDGDITHFWGGLNDLFVVKLDESVISGVQDQPFQSEPLTIYPQPASGKLNIRCDSFLKSGQTIYINIRDMFGRIIFQSEEKIFSSELSVSIGSVLPGYYIIECYNNNFSYRKPCMVSNFQK